MSTYRLFPSTNGPASPTAASGGWLLGVIFSTLGQMSWLDGYYHWCPPGGDTVAHKFALWNRYSTSAQNLVAGSVVTSGTLTANSWNYVPLATPIQLAPGALYVAAVGWTVTNGIPLTAGQFTSGGAYSAGIVNGPLTAWSAIAGSNPFPAATTNYGMGQGVFSNALGADPSTAMPNNPSGSDNFWLDVQLSDTAPAGYSGSYRFLPNMTDLGNWSMDTANGFTLGKEFSLSAACTIDNIWFYSPAGVSVLPSEVGVYQVSNSTLVASNASPSWSGAAASGWISTPLSGTLQAGVNYKVAILQGTNVTWNGAVANYWSTGFGANGLTSGPLSAPSNAAATSPGQESYNLGATIAYPGTNAGPYAYGLDIEVSIAPVLGAATLSGTGTLTAAGQKTVPGAAALAGSGTLTATGQKLVPGAAALSGLGTLTAAGQKAAPGAAALSGTGTLTATGTASFPGAASLSGSGTLTATGLAAIPASASLSGLGTLAASGALTVPGAAALSGLGTLTAAGSVTMLAAAALSGLGTLTATGQAVTPAGLLLVSLGTARWLWTLGVARNETGESLVQLSQSALSTQPVQVQVQAITSTGTAYDPTSDTVQMAFVPQAEPPASPTGSDWQSATWETDSSGNHWATCLVGPQNGGVSLAFGAYTIWAMVTSSPAIPVLPGPILSIF